MPESIGWSLLGGSVDGHPCAQKTEKKGAVSIMSKQELLIQKKIKKLRYFNAMSTEDVEHG